VLAPRPGVDCGRHGWRVSGSEANLRDSSSKEEP
jgi:hypothetical protein